MRFPVLVVALLMLNCGPAEEVEVTADAGTQEKTWEETAHGPCGIYSTPAKCREFKDGGR